MTMWKEMKENYRASARFAVALPLIFAMPVLVEGLQHVAEWRIGMFESGAMAEAVSDHPARMSVGYVKTALLCVMGYWVWRFLGFKGDLGRVLRFDRTAIALFALVLAFQAAQVVVQNQAGTLLGATIATEAGLFLTGLALILAAMALEIYIAAWKVGAALGNRRMGPLASLRTMHGSIAWGYGFTLLMFFPVMILHYLLNGLAIGRPAAIAWPLLTLDALVVGYLAVLLPTTVFIVARRAAGRRGIDLAAREELQPRAA
jgi:hypothetical protein